MEAIGAGANILAFVLLALNTAKATYETLSAVKDGPEIVKKVTANVNQLCWILHNLEKSSVAINDHSVLGHLKICCDELNSAASLIKKLQITPRERHTGKLWKKLRIFLGEKDLEKLNDQLTLDVAILQLRLQGISSNAILSLQQSHTQFEQTIGVLKDTLQTQTDVHNTSLSTLKRDICDAVNGQSNTVRTLLTTMHEGISARDTISKSHGDLMVSILGEIKDLLITPPIQQQTHHSATDDSCELVQSIDRLCRLIHNKEKVINTYANKDDEESQSIIEDLQTILRTANKRGKPFESYETSMGSQRPGIRDFERVSRRFERVFDQYKIAINQGDTSRKRPPYKIAKLNRFYQKLHMNIGTITLSSKYRTRSSHAAYTSNQQIEDKSYSDYSSTFIFLPNDRRKFHMIVASIFQRETEFGVISSISQLDVNRILPLSSRVFKVVENGDLCELQRMLESGEASLRDHNEWGQSLLFYSMNQPQMCKFLVENGLDVDCVDEVPWRQGKRRVSKTALQHRTGSPITDANELIRSQSCCRILLEAGADPTISFTSSRQPFLALACDYGSADLIRLAFNPELTGYITSINDPILGRGSTPLLLYCHRYQGIGYDKEMLRLFLDLGADINSRDDSLNTCLHLFLGHWFYLPGYENLKFLIEMGADVRAIDSEGKAVSYYAYSPPNPIAENVGSYRGDVWDAALQSCGYNIAEFRTERYRRVASYTDEYKREDFEQLWQGREHLCPYWDDSPWPALEVCSTYDSDSDIEPEDSKGCHNNHEGSESWDSDSEDGGVPLQ